MFKVSFTFFLLVFSGSLIAVKGQVLHSIEGRLLDHQNNPLKSALVQLKSHPDSALVKTAISDEAGYFRFNQVQRGSYLVIVKIIGFNSSSIGPVSIAQNSLKLGDILLTPSVQQLDEVTVTTEKSFIDAKPGKIVLSVDESALAAGKNLEQLIRLAPGVEVNDNGVVTLNGREGVLVTIDGKPTHLSSSDQLNLLQGFQSTSVDQIEVLSNPGAAYDAAGSAGIINIKLKKELNNGTNGTLSLSGGVGNLCEKYSPSSKFSPGLAINSRSKNLNIFANYTFSGTQLQKRTALNRNINNPGDVSTIDLKYNSRTNRTSNVYRAGADYNLSPDHLIGVMVNGLEASIGIAKNNISDIINQGIQKSQITTNSDQKRRVGNFGLNLNYKGTLGKRDNQLSADFDYVTYYRRSEELLTNRAFSYISKMPLKDVLFRNNSPAGYYIKSVKADYSISISRNQELDLGVKSSLVRNNNVLNFGMLNGQQFIPDAAFSNEYHFKEYINSFYSTYGHSFKKSSLMLGLRAEYVSSNGTSLSAGNFARRNYLNLFPNIQYSYTLSDAGKLMLSLSRRIQRPDYEDLNPFIAYLDQYSYRAGNSFLRPQYSNNAEITHVYRDKITTTLRFNITKDVFPTIYQQNNTTLVTTVSRQNLDKLYTYGIVVNAPAKPASWWKMNVNVAALYVHYTSTSNGGSLSSGSPDITLRALQSFSLPNGFTADLNSGYETPSFYGISNYSAIYSTDIGISKGFFNKRATLKMSATDIFNTSQTRYRSSYQNLDLSGREKTESRVLLLSFNWLFGKSAIGAARKRNTSSDAEQTRIGNL